MSNFGVYLPYEGYVRAEYCGHAPRLRDWLQVALFTHKAFCYLLASTMLRSIRPLNGCVLN